MSCKGYEEIRESVAQYVLGSINFSDICFACLRGAKSQASHEPPDRCLLPYLTAFLEENAEKVIAQIRKFTSPTTTTFKLRADITSPATFLLIAKRVPLYQIWLYHCCVPALTSLQPPALRLSTWTILWPTTGTRAPSVPVTLPGPSLWTDRNIGGISP